MQTKTSKKSVIDLIKRYPELAGVEKNISDAIDQIIDCFQKGGTLFLAGNGGSAADCDHIAGEFLKGFKSLRPLPQEEKDLLTKKFGEDGALLGNELQCGLRCISLLSHPGFNSAFANDVNADLMFAQQLNALSREGDVFLGISTGGGAKNIKYAMMAAKLKNVKTFLLTGNKHGICEKYADLVIAVDEKETYKIQELHLPVYHAICLAVEEEFFRK